MAYSTATFQPTVEVDSLIRCTSEDAFPPAPSVFTTPIPNPPETSDDARSQRRSTVELRLMERAESAPLKIRWRRSWTPDKLATLAQLYTPERLRVRLGSELDLDRLAVNFLRHDKTAYEHIVHRNFGLIRGQLGEYPSIYLIVKARVNASIAADFCWLADEADRQMVEARHRVADTERTRLASRGRTLSSAACPNVTKRRAPATRDNRI